MSKINCDEEALRKLRAAVLHKHGKIYGALLKEVNVALLERAKALEQEQSQIIGGR